MEYPVCTGRDGETNMILGGVDGPDLFVNVLAIDTNTRQPIQNLLIDFDNDQGDDNRQAMVAFDQSSIDEINQSISTC
jgi:hypothetical protein